MTHEENTEYLWEDPAAEPLHGASAAHRLQRK